MRAGPGRPGGAAHCLPARSARGHARHRRRGLNQHAATSPARAAADRVPIRSPLITSQLPPRGAATRSPRASPRMATRRDARPGHAALLATAVATPLPHPRPMDTSNPFTLLAREWADVGASAQAGRALRRWSEVEPALAGFDTPAEVVARCQQRGDSRSANDLLGALLRLAGDPLAARAVLAGRAAQPGPPGLAAALGRQGRGRRALGRRGGARRRHGRLRRRAHRRAARHLPGVAVAGHRRGQLRPAALGRPGGPTAPAGRRRPRRPP